MFKHRFFILLFFLLVIIATLHPIGLALLWYWPLGSFDLFMHFLGGMWIAGMALWFCYLSGLVRPHAGEMKWVFLIASLAGLTVGALWEVFEILIKDSVLGSEGYALDTATDLIADFLGAGASAWYFWARGYSRGANLKAN